MVLDDKKQANTPFQETHPACAAETGASPKWAAQRCREFNSRWQNFSLYSRSTQQHGFEQDFFD